jgi:hypothetical protein
MTSDYRCLGLLLLFAASSGIAQNQNSYFGDTFTISLGALLNNADASLGATLDDNESVDLNLDDLGVGRNELVYWSQLSWKFSQRWRWDLTYSAFDGSGIIEANTSGNFGDISYDAGASLTSDLDVDLFITDINYDFISGARGRLGAGIGFHVTNINFDLLANLEVMTDEGAFEQVVRTETTEVLAPLPNLSLSGGYRLGEKVYWSAEVGYLSLNINKYDGEIFSVRTQLEWRPWKRLGIGAAYQYVDLDLTVDEGRIEERYKLELDGPALFLTYGF